MSILKTVANVEIMETGTFACASGTHDFTSADLESAIAAINNDPAVKDPRIKLGHVGEHGSTIGLPTFGKVQNCRLESEGNKLVGDLVGIPDWLEEILPSAYPNRSIEGDWDVTTSTGQTHRFVIHSLSLLGVELPGISTLEDLQTLYEEGPEAVKATHAVVAQYRKDEPVTVRASVDPYDVRSSFYDSFAVGDRYSWWCHELYIDPMEIIAEDETANKLYRVPYVIASDGKTVEFGDPEEVEKQYVTVTASGPKVVQAAENRPSLVFASREESRQAVQANEEETVGIDIPALRERTGLTAEQLPDDATEEQINTILAEAPPEPEETEEEEETEASAEEDEEEETSAEVPEGKVLVDAEAWAEVQAGAKAGAEVYEDRRKSGRDSVINAAVKAGKIPPSSRANYERMFASDEKGFKQLLTASVKEGGLDEGLIPVSMRGTAENDSVETGQQAESETPLTELFPELRKEAS